MAELFKFRCPSCAKLLGVPPRKAGRPIHCPQCGAEVVPQPSGDPADDDPDDQPEDAIDLGHLGIDLGGPSLASPLRPAEAPKARPLLEGPDVGKLVDDFLRSAPGEPSLHQSPPEPGIDEGEADEDDAEPLVQPSAEPLTAGPTRRGRRARAGPRPGRDVVLPRTAVVAWSLFAILALGLSFLAGLLVGRYRWR